MTVPLIALMWLIHWLPFRCIGWISRPLGSLLYLFAGERRRVGALNLALCMPELDEAARTDLLKAHFREMAHVLLEYGYCWFAPTERMRRLVKVDGLEQLTALGETPAILFTGHMTGLELAGIRLSIDVPVVTMFTRQKHRGLDQYIESKRLRFNTGIVISRQDGIKPAIRALKRGYRLYYLPDQDLGTKESVFVPFFGVPAATITSLSRLAAVTRSAVLPLSLARERDGYRLTIEPPLANYPSPDLEVDAARMNQELELRIRRQPAHYFWLHKRFKTRPTGEPKYY